jgi:hypothetical protein
MKTTNSLLLVILLFVYPVCITAQQKEIIPNLTEVKNPDLWAAQNRKVSYKDAVYLNGQPGDGMLWLKDINFKNGVIELDIKGSDAQGRSFVGLAFHGLNDSTYDVVYFRPFNFENPERKGHSVQYISHPQFTWYRLREEHPGKYENMVNPVPDPKDWFHVTIKMLYPDVKVFVNDSKEASLEVSQLSSQKGGWIGFWVGNNSEGYFNHLKITMDDK